MAPSAAEPSSNSPPTITPTERIRELSAIDKDVAKLLEHAGQAIQTLTGNSNPSEQPCDSPMDHDASSPDDSQKERFQEQTAKYFNSVQSVSALLRRQAYALEEAKIIPAESRPFEAQVQVAPGQPRPMQVTNGGLGKLDVSWLNSKRDDVGKRKEAELWAEARARLDKMKKSEEEEAENEDMDVDSSSNTAA